MGDNLLAEQPKISPVAMPSPEPASTDQKLIAALNAGDTAAFEAMYLRHRDWVTHLALRFTGDRDAAFTVLQETFRYVADKFPGFDLACQFRSFLYPVVKNISLMERRRSDRVVRLEERLQREPEPHRGAPPMRDGDGLATLLAVLTEEHREVVVLRFVEDFDVKDIAAALQVPEGTVKSRLHHALKQLRESPRTRHCFPDHGASQASQHPLNEP
jgi:RNA polymerase sigma-70 factor (ECF subfamily)